MNRLFPLSLAAAALAATAFAAEPAPGYVDFGKLIPADQGTFVEVNVPTGLLKFAATLAAKQEPQAAQLLGNLKHVRVNVVELNDANRQQMLERVKTVRQELQSQGWNQIVTVREQPKGDDVQIFARTGDDAAIQGLVVTVIDNGNEVVLVNVVGEIKPEQLAELANRFDIEPLKKLKLPAPAPATQS